MFSVKPTVFQVSQVIGILISNLPGVEYGQLHYQSLEIDKIEALRDNSGDYNASMQLSATSILDLKWWINNVPFATKLIMRPNPLYFIKSDASKLGWGAVMASQSIGGRWTAAESLMHINYLELLASYFALKAFGITLTHCHIQLQLDNTTAVAYVNHMGGMQSSDLNDLTIKLWQWCIEHSIWISAVHIAGTSNTVADTRSRVFHDNHEYMLNRSSFKTILDRFPNLNIDLFATRLNHQLEQYVSWKPDPGCMAVDAFSINWHSSHFYAFPPFSLIGRCLQKICVDQASGVMIVPLWPTQTWFPSLLQMLFHQPWVLVAEPSLLEHPVTQEPHPLHQALHLLVCPVSGIPSQVSTFQQKLPISSCNLGARVLRNNMRHTFENGCTFVIKGKLLTIHRQ